MVKQGPECSLMLARQDEIIAFFKQRDEIESMLICRGLQTERRVRSTRLHCRRGLTVRDHSSVVTLDFFSRDLETPQLSLEPQARPRTGIAIHKADIWPGNIRNLFDIFGVAVCEHKSLCAISQRDNFHVAIWKQMTDKWCVVFAAFIQKMRATDLTKSLTEIYQAIQ